MTTHQTDYAEKGQQISSSIPVQQFVVSDQNFQNPENISSEFQMQYQEATAGFRFTSEALASMEIKLLQKGIEIERRYFHPSFRAELTNFTKNFQALLFQVTFGYFKIAISVLLTQNISQSHNFPDIHYSSNCTIFLFQSQSGHQHSIKCLQLKQTFFNETISWVFREVCILKIASALQIGPKMSDLFGFDIIIYGNCVQFAMQFCQKVQEVNQQQVEMLTRKLSLLHAFNLVHLDIKPSNIMFSPALKEIVFIDFGLSKHIQQPIGTKTMVNFSGSLTFCGQQMLKAYNTKTAQYVDLYYNDIICLNRSVIELTPQTEQENRNTNNRCQQRELAFIMLLQFDQYFKKANPYLIFIKAKYYFFSNLEFQISMLNSSQFMSKYYFALNDFVANLKDSRYMKYIRYVFQKLEQMNDLTYANIQSRFKYEIKNNVKQFDVYFQQNDQQAHFVKVISSLLYSKSNQIFHLVNHQNRASIWLLEQQKLKQIKNIPYLIKCYADFTDFRRSQSSFAQKVAASILLSKVVNLQIIANLQDKQILSFCQKQLLYRFIETNQTYYEQLIPIFVRNLLILNAITCLQIIQLCKKILGKSIDSKQKLKLKVKLELICLLFNDLNFEYYDPLVLRKMFAEVYLIQVEQPFLSALQGMKDQILNDKPKTYNSTRANVKKLFQKTYFYDSFIDQIIVWRLAHLQTTSQTNYRDQESLNWLKLEFNESYDLKYNYEFDFYYFSLMYYPNSNLRTKIIYNLYQKMKKCIQRQDILKQFMVYYFYWNREIRKLPLEQQLTYFSSMANQLIFRYLAFQEKQESSFLVLDFLLDRREIEILSELFYFCICNQNNQRVKSILTSLKKIVAVDILQQIATKIRKNMDQKNLYHNSFGSLFIKVICFYYWNLYKDDPELVQSLNNFCSEIDSQMKVAQFPNKLVQIQYDYTLVTIKIKAFEISDQPENKIKCYEDFIVRNLRKEPLVFINSDFFNHPFVTYIYNCIKLDFEGKGLPALQFYYRAVMEYEQFKTLFSLEKFNHSYHYLIKYIILYKDLQIFMDFQTKLSTFLSRCPYENYVKDYLKSFKSLGHIKFKKRLNQCWNFLKVKPKKYFSQGDNNYIIILYSYLLTYINISCFQKTNDPQFNRKLIICISKRVDKIDIHAKQYALAHLYHFLYFFDSSKLLINKKYLKFREKFISFQKFKKVMNFKSSKSRHLQFKSSLQAKLKIYHKLITN